MQHGIIVWQQGETEGGRERERDDGRQDFCMRSGRSQENETTVFLTKSLISLSRQRWTPSPSEDIWVEETCLWFDLNRFFLLFYFLGHAEAVKPAGTTTLMYRHLMKLLRPACLQAVAVFFFFFFFFYTSSQLEKHYHCSGVIFLTPGECESNIHSPFSSVPFFFNPLPREISGSLAARRSTMLASCSFCQCAVYFSSIQVGVGEVFFFFFSRKQLLLRVWCRK